jgi:hypothetical protein
MLEVGDGLRIFYSVEAVSSVINKKIFVTESNTKIQFFVSIINKLKNGTGEIEKSIIFELEV